MARFGFVGGSHTAQAPNWNAQRTVNWYPERDESGDAKSAIALLPTPGLSVFAAVPGPLQVLGLLTINARTFAVIGGNLYELSAAGILTPLGAVGSDTNPVSMAASPQQLAVASAGVLYVYQLQAQAGLPAGTFTKIPVATFIGPVAQVGYSDGFFLALVTMAQKFYVSNALDATTWQGANSKIISTFPDNVVSMIVDHREVWLLGAKASEGEYDSGNLFPFDTIPGGFVEQGCGAQFATVQLDNSIFWIGARNDQGAGIAWRANGYVPARVSNHAVETAWQAYATLADARAFPYQDRGHSFWQINFPSAQATWVYDVATGQWHEREWWNVTAGVYEAHRAQCHTFNFGKHLVGDRASGKIYVMSIANLTDFGGPIRRLRRAPHISTEQSWIYHSQFQVDLEVGLPPVFPGPNPPPLAISLIDPVGKVWTLVVTGAGALQTQGSAIISVNDGQPVFLNDATNAASWQLGVTAAGAVTTTAVAFKATYPKAVTLISTGGAFVWDIGVTLGGLLQTSPNANPGVVLNPPMPQQQLLDGAGVPRAPQAMLRYSDDGGHTWTNIRTVDCGKTGEYKTRVIWRRLGRSRDRVYELSVSDPIPWRIVDAYLHASPGYQPTERLIAQLRKSA